MSKPSTQQVASWAKAATSTEWQPLRKVSERALRDRWTGQSDDQISDFVDEHLSFLASHLQVEMSEAELDGAVCGFEIDDEDDPYVRSVGLNTDEVLLKLKSICSFEFENVCKRMLDQLGGQSKVTQKSRDGGIDFFSIGIDILPDGIAAPIQCRASVIGQAKRFADKLVAERALREFVGASVLKRHELRVTENVSPLTPVLLAFWTTSDFDPHCKAFARNTGVWLMDGRTVASYIHRLKLSDWVLSLPNLEDRPGGTGGTRKSADSGLSTRIQD